MVKNACGTVQQCKQYWLMDTNFEHQRQTNLFSQADHLQFVTVDTTCPIPQAKTVNQLAAIINSRYRSHTRTLSIAKLAWTKVVHISFTDLLIPYNIADFILSDNGQQFVRKLFMPLYIHQIVKMLIATAFEMQQMYKSKRITSQYRLYLI